LVQQADRDEVDRFFHTRDGAPPGLHQRLLFRERYVLAGRAGHPALRSPLSLAQFCQLEQVIVSPDGGGFSAATDSALANLGLARRVVLSVPHFLFMLETLRNSELVAMFFTAMSYWSMSRAFPVSGSVYAYAQRGIHPIVGFFAGWLILLDYILVPSLLYIVSAAALAPMLPGVPGWLW
ncbi:LysR substrate-binding domain-containing protein, partial [Klebsiella michiganensis]